MAGIAAIRSVRGPLATSNRRDRKMRRSL